jgi:hypothetical protein
MSILLTLEVPVVSRPVGRTVQRQDTVFVEHGLHAGYGVLPCSVHTHDERRAVPLELRAKSAATGCPRCSAGP